MDIQLRIQNIKNIKSFNYNFRFEDGIYALVGENAVGKSTLMSAIASIVYQNTLRKLDNTDVNEDAFIEIQIQDQIDRWELSARNLNFEPVSDAKLRFYGIYEGSIFSGTRFEDMKNIDDLIQKNPKFVSKFVPATRDLKDAMSMILHYKKNKYENLYKLSNMDIARKHNLNNMPYFYKLSNGDYISKYKMSSGECMLISLLNFINSTALKPSIIRKRRQVFGDRLFIFIDEVELALHPSSIVRLVKYLEEMCEKKKLTVLFSSHSSELIKMIKPKNIFLLENDNGDAEIITPCYPHYAIRSLYNHDGNDCTILVEDELAKIIVTKFTEEFRINNNLLMNVLPAGSWGNILNLQESIFNQNILGKDKFVFSILDGDVKDEINGIEKYRHLRKLFLPIYSLEKYLYDRCIKHPNKDFITVLGKKLFTYEPIQTIINEFNMNYIEEDRNGKTYYNFLLKKLQIVKVEEESFVSSVSELIINIENFNKIKQNIERFIYENYNVKKK